jgi:nucleoside-diphosphate-sugar epimerase
MRVFITGATGVIGRRVVPMLVAAGHRVTAMVHSPQKSRNIAGSGASLEQADLFDPVSLRHAVAGKDAVINLATHLPEGWRMFLPGAWAENDRIRREGAANLVDAALGEGVPRFIQESFAPVYPDRGAQWIDETIPIAPVRYNRTVADAEASVERFSARGGVGTALRFGAFYGPDAWQTRDMIGYVRRGFAPMPGPAEAYVSSISHDDAAAAVVAALDAPGGTYNVVDDEPVTHRGYVGTLASLLGVSAPRLPPRWLTFLFGSPGELLARSQRISNRKLRAACDWTPKYRSVREGLQAVLGSGAVHSPVS